MVREAEVTELGAIDDAYRRWTVANNQLQQMVGEAAEHHAGAPVDALSADFEASLAVTRAVINFADVCRAGGPDVDGVPGAAFVQALYQVVVTQPALEQELAQLGLRWESWISRIGGWRPEHGTLPARPVSAAHSRVLAAVDDWWGFGADRRHDHLVQALAAPGQHVTESLTTGPNGVLTRSSVFEHDEQPTATAGPGSRRPRAWLSALLRYRGGRRGGHEH